MYILLKFEILGTNNRNKHSDIWFVCIITYIIFSVLAHSAFRRNLLYGITIRKLITTCRDLLHLYTKRFAEILSETINLELCILSLTFEVITGAAAHFRSPHSLYSYQVRPRVLCSEWPSIALNSSIQAWKRGTTLFNLFDWNKIYTHARLLLFISQKILNLFLWCHFLY